MMNVMWTNASFAMYMGQRDAFASAAFEPALQQAVLLGNLPDTECSEASERAPRLGLATLALNAFTAGRRLVRG